jgi:hypothetical protein
MSQFFHSQKNLNLLIIDAHVLRLKLFHQPGDNSEIKQIHLFYLINPMLACQRPCIVTSKCFFWCI